MEKTLGAVEARRHLGRILKDVADQGDRYVLEDHGEPVAAVVPMVLYRQWRQRREVFFDRLDEMAATADLSTEEAEHVSAEAVQAVRAIRPT